MNRKNNDMLTTPNLNYTSRDFNSIYNELLSSIPNLTSEWSPIDDNDPGVVLLKAIAMLGDMLSYNQDRQALEAFPRTVLQRTNAQQLFRLIGYKMHWYRSATVNASFTNANSFPLNIARYNVFTNNDGSIKYTNLTDIVIPPGVYGINAFTSTLIQGTPVTPLMTGSIKPEDYNAAWHSCYGYNVNANDIINNKLYLKYKNIDESSIMLIDNDETPFATNEWKLVDNINLNTTMDKVFELDIDEHNNIYVLLPEYWQTKFVITKFKLFMVLSDGNSGEIEENVLTKISSKKCYVEQSNINVNMALKQVSIFNESSTYGYNPQTCTEARIDAEKYVNTLDTLITLKDFEKAIRRINSIANVLATDIQIDPNKNEMSNYQINLWIVRKNNYNNSGDNYIYALDTMDKNSDEIFKENIIGELKSFKLMPYNININLENKIDWIDWTVAGQIHLRKPINSDENYDLMVRINDNLKNRFNTTSLDFNEAINYMDVMECIMSTDSNIWYVDLNTSAIEYSKVKRSIKGNETGLSIKNKYMIYDVSEGKYSGYYVSSLGCTSTYINKVLPYVNVDSKEYELLTKTNYNLTNNGMILAQDVDVIRDERIDNEYTALTNSTINSKTTISDNDVSYGGTGYGKNVGNKIVREDGLETVVGVDFGAPNEPREYEIFNKLIYDYTSNQPKFTNYYIDNDSNNELWVYKFDESGNSIKTNYKLVYDSRMYLSDGSDAHRYLKLSYKQISQLCSNSDEIYTIDKLNSLSNNIKEELVANNIIRKVYDIYESFEGYQDEWTGESIDILTGEIFMLRGEHWYIANRSYDEDTGNILDIYGPVQYDEYMMIQRNAACKEDVTGEYIQEIAIKDNQLDFEFYLGQDANGNQLKDSIGNVINAYPIKPYSVFIYINGDQEIIADNGSGKLSSTPGLLDGWGTIDYDTGFISFKTNIVPHSMRIIYKVNKITYAHYVNFDTNTFFVNPQYLRNNNRK